jgi:hypothetical protein
MPNDEIPGSDHDDFPETRFMPQISLSPKGIDVKYRDRIPVTLPQELAQKMADFPEVNWAVIAREAFTDYIAYRKNAMSLEDRFGEMLDKVVEAYKNQGISIETIQLVLHAVIQKFVK